jgi:signal transduction histidine kinase
MTLLLALVVVSLALILVTKLYASERRASKNLESKIDNLKSNQDYLITLIKDIQDVTGYGSDVKHVLDVIVKSLESKFSFSTISYAYRRDDTLLFYSQAKETVSHAFINHIKDSMISEITESVLTTPPPAPSSLPQNPPSQGSLPQTAVPPHPPQPLLPKLEIGEEIITGLPLDDMANSEIKSSAEIRLMINTKAEAIINMSSTSPSLYSEEDKRLLSAISTLVSDYLTRLDVLLGLEKSKSLAMIDSLTDGIFMIDRDTNLIAMNDSAMNLLNIHAEIPTLNDVLTTLPNTYNFKDKIDRVLSKNIRIEEDNVNINDKIFKVTITPVLEINIPGKNVIGASVLLKDVTLEKSLAQLKEDFTNVMVHELRSPLTAIKASSEFLMSQAEFTEAEKKRLVEMISESAKKMLDKISLILDSAKLEAGLFTLKKTQSDLKKLIQDRISVFGPVASEKSIELKVNIDPNIPIFSFDPLRIDEVLNNLLSNSLKFTPEHGTISIQAMVTQDKVLISVTDTGEGIPKEKQGKLFTKYQQAPTDGLHVGTGLGLYVVKQIVEDHGGTVSLVSDVGKGTTITFSLPLHPALTIPKPGEKPIIPQQKMVN